MSSTPENPSTREWWAKTAQSVGIVLVIGIVLLLLYSCSVSVKVDVQDPQRVETTR